MLGVSPQSKLNCEVLDETLAFEVRWAVAGESIVIQLVSKLDGREYMSFGLSGDVSKSIMIGGDVVVAWVDKDTLKGYAEDYHLADKAQCSGPTGSCPDNKFAENTNNIRLLNAAMVNGYSIVTYQRPLKASDQYDLPIYTNQSQAIIWAVGPLNQRDEVSFHTSYLKKDNFIDFARPAKWNCPLPQNDSQNRQLPPIQTKRPEITDEPSETVEYKEISTSAPRRDTGTRRRGSNRGTSRPATTTEATTKENQILRREPTRTRGSTTKSSQRVSQAVPPTPTPVNSRDAWYIPPIECYEPEDGVFYAQMGPTGGKRGYPAITGHVGWGISWYINGLLIPEINVVRGKTYNFITEGGENPEISAKYHPFYITDDPIGGYSYKSPEEKKNITIFAGVRYEDGEAIPTGTGRLCHWTQTGEKDADDFESFGAYQRTLQLKCDVGEPGVVTWTPDSYTPDTVYYQCFTHRYLGWKINVHDTCEQAKASELQISIAERPADFQAFSDSSLELEASPSIRQETRVMPNRIIIEEITSDNWSQHAVSEVPTTTLDPITTPIIISQKKSDLLTPNTSFFLPKTPHNFFIDSNNRRPNFDQTNGDFLRKQVITTERSITTRKLNQPLVYIKPNLKNPLYPSFKKPVYKQRRVRPYSSSGSKIQLHKNVFNTPIRPQLSQTPIFAQKPIKHVEISPQQASTEREPNLQNSGLSTFIRQSSEEKSVTYQTPKNKGFDPDSIVIEGGFKPIIAKRADDRIDLEIDSEGQSGVIDVKQKKNFIRTPIGHEIVKVIIRSRSLIDSDVEPEMAAAEREEVYYLPPPGPIAISKSPNLPSELDFEAPAPPDTPTVTKDAVSPPDVVVTFDGKRVSGASLTAKPFDKAIVLQRGSKATELLRGHPQSVPFRGDLPPLDPNVLFKENSAAAPNTGVLNRNLDTPLLTSGTTKLQRVRRRAHHTPEHTAQQKQEKPYQNQAYKANSTCFVLVLGAFLLKIVS
ncbi:hypothetical protein ABEB36_010317 [Hypothenemus hampei]|uniref:DOMON domain-containing protein n=1 Tax=Hypothenemus hampei TaxID=57062 RepID=A0ABD1EJA0_HYPHA